MTRTARAMVLERFNESLVPTDLPIPELEEGALLVRIAAAGICGSDLEIIQQRDPRLSEDLLPLIPGHEGVGWVAKVGEECRDLSDRRVEPGDLVVWNRGISCGRCYYCAVRRQRALCPHREVYGISLSARAPRWLNGCYAEILYVRPGSEVIVLPSDCDPASIVAATCSGATAAHAAELAGIEPGSNVLVIGPGPLGLFCAAFALAQGAGHVFVAATPRSQGRLAIAEAMGCRGVDAEELQDWQGPRISTVLDAAGTGDSVRAALRVVDRGGTVALPGVASPIGEVGIDVYTELARKNVRLQGVWVSDAAHLHRAVGLVLSKRYNLEMLVTHRFPLSQANEALQSVASREAVKAVLVPE